MLEILKDINEDNLQGLGLHPDDREEIIEAAHDSTLLYIRHDLVVLLRENGFIRTQMAFSAKDNITKENFFNLMEQSYPAGFKRFTKWIDKFKADNEWKDIFGHDVKFHSVPFFIQHGIIIKFISEVDPTYKFVPENKKEATVALEDVFRKISINTPGSLSTKILDVAMAVITHEQASTSFIQRHFKVGYDIASKMIGELLTLKIIGEFRGTQPREIFIKNDADAENKVKALITIYTKEQS